MEPLIEVYRQFQYECNTKRSYLSRKRETASNEIVLRIDKWFDLYGIETVKIMKKYLKRYKQGHLTFNDLSNTRDELIADIREFYTVLPDDMQFTEAYDTHTKTLDFKTVDSVDHGWDHAIPVTLPEFQFQAHSPSIK